MKINEDFNSIDEALQAYLLSRKQSYRARKGPRYWNASGLGQCLRKQYFTRENRPPTHPSKTEYDFTAMDGNASHEWRQKALKKLGILIKAEGKITNRKYQYRGHFDAIIKLKDGLSLLDFKTQGSRAWYHRKMKWQNIVPSYHQMQLGSYFLFLRKKYPELQDVRLYYYNRDTGEREEFKITFSDKFLSKITDELDLLNKYWKTKTIPQAIDTKERNKCKYCEFRGYCDDVLKRGYNNHSTSKTKNHHFAGASILRKRS